MKNKPKDQRLIPTIINGIVPTTNQTKKAKQIPMPVLDDVRLPYVPIKETAVSTNAMGSSAPANPASPIAMPEKLLKKPKKRLNDILKRKFPQ